MSRFCIFKNNLKVDDHIKRTLAEEEATGGIMPLAEASGEEGRELYPSGTFKSSGIKKIDVFLTTKVQKKLNRI